MDELQVDIIGPGAMGLHCALALPARCQVTLRHPDYREGTTEISDDTGRRRQVRTRPLNDPSRIAAALVTTKAGRVASAVQTVLPALDAEAEILLLHNGLGPQDQAADCMSPGQRLYVGITTEGALREGPGVIRHTGRGSTLAGPWRTPVTPGPLIEALCQSSLQAHWEPDPSQVRFAVWRKLIINCAINPLTALHNLPNGGLLTDTYRPAWVALTQLACQVARAEGIRIDVPEMLEQVETVMRATARNYSSMQQDVQHGRETEAPQILGELIRRGRQHSIDMQPLEELVSRVVNSGH
ncbi:MAG: 2-dehydropantoate 2-reductase [Natronospirillum sp.]|uniref:ketopantoate reductase family protein n=1 Tax=Natronospirillum sp. TaxID=2812955 RepID=UPI0025D2701E|nr:2-dehydropantoate 2-reductase [Natronospirillum sp.]MCH8551964.1 2-dehydropantoate 2-reductase [Natronospirillum sp.]